jgi:hypothetical protein
VRENGLGGKRVLLGDEPAAFSGGERSGLVGVLASRVRPSFGCDDVRIHEGQIGHRIEDLFVLYQPKLSLQRDPLGLQPPLAIS